MHDVLVVGAGPAGSRLARRLAERGLDVLAFEQGRVGEPLACSGHVSTDIWEFTPPGARERLLQNTIQGARFHPDGFDGDTYRFHRDEQISAVIDRVALDRELAEAARRAGAEIREQHTVVGLTERREHVELAVRGAGGIDHHRGRLVAGCDGPNSRVRTETGLPDPEELLHGVLGFRDDPDHEAFVDVHLTVPRFFAWRIPRGDAGVEYGLATPPGAAVTNCFETFTDAYGVETDRRCSGLIPVGPPPTTTSGRVFLVGDAAGHNKPFTGGGILYGMTAADCAAETVDPADPATLADYERAWREELAGDIRVGHLVRAGYSAPGPLQHALMGLFEGEIGVHMDRPTTLFSCEQLRAMLPRL
jgi:geranylgeranyl reductase family protein